jgi:hypothetical protein
MVAEVVFARHKYFYFFVPEFSARKNRVARPLVLPRTSHSHKRPERPNNPSPAHRLKYRSSPTINNHQPQSTKHSFDSFVKRSRRHLGCTSTIDQSTIEIEINLTPLYFRVHNSLRAEVTSCISSLSISINKSTNSNRAIRSRL